MIPVNEDDQGVTFGVLAVTRASRERIGPVVGDRLKVQVTSPPVDGEANAAIASSLARAFRVAKNAVKIVHGASSRRKTVRIDGMRKAVFERLVAELGD
ncbi:MAG TPA: DUF167 domain-containing protein [Myxococcaceae bacterium]|nr:DUF167 domain-containing protein [Myxococcaceae bacterium]